jgi:hypothetical protein
MKITGKYTTKTTAYKYGLNERIQGFIDMMADFEKTVKVGKDFVEIFDNETGESMDFAHYVIVIGKDGEKYGNLMLTEMESLIDIGESLFADTILDEIEISGLPLCCK